MGIVAKEQEICSPNGKERGILDGRQVDMFPGRNHNFFSKERME